MVNLYNYKIYKYKGKSINLKRFFINEVRNLNVFSVV